MDELRVREAPWMTRRARRWHQHNTFGARDVPDLAELAGRARAEGSRISVGIPALNEESTIGSICSTIVQHLVDGARLVDELVVLDGGSDDGTVAAAHAAGADVVDARCLMPSIPPVRGKGESLWRSLARLRGDIVVWIDADIRNFDQRFVSRLVAPLLLNERLAFTKGFYRRPIERDGRLEPSGGGRVTELLARPMLAAMFPELGGFLQPLSGEYAGRREILTQVPFFTGYSVEVGLLIDLLGVVDLEALAQVDLEERVHRNRPLSELGPMAYAIGRTILQRAEAWGRVRLDGSLGHPLLLPEEDSLTEHRVEELERPPLASLSRRVVAAG